MVLFQGNPNITLGTAGHIDHGKTALVKLLTGCETDRLREEKERGMSIELGFAPCMISDMMVGVVDVPGHENFVKTMVAGASGIDGVIFVVAADDGIMPQTREHFDILTLLGIRHGIVALTKIDRVDAETVEIVTDDLREYFRGTFLEGAPVLPISNITGEGYDPFYMALMDMVKGIEPKSPDGVFRVPVERTFSVKGFGTVVSGIPVTGSAKIGDEVELLPQGVTGRINGLQVYNRQSEVALAGQCAALNVRHWEQNAIDRGNVVATPGFFSPNEWYACDLSMLDCGGFFIKSGTTVKFHTGTSETTAKVFPVTKERVHAHDGAIIQVRLEHPLVAGPGDHFILRSLSPITTVGGGTIIEALPHKLKRTRPEVVAEIEARSKAVLDERAFVEYAVRSAEGFSATISEVSRRTKLPVEAVQKIIDGLVSDGRVIDLSKKAYIHADTVKELSKLVVETLKAFLEAAPSSPGMTSQELVEKTGIPKPVLDGVLETMKSGKSVEEAKGYFKLPGHAAEFSDEDQRLIDRIEPLFKERAFTPPTVPEAATETGISEREAGRIVKLLIQHKRLVRVDEKTIFHAEAVEKARKLLADHFAMEERLESVKFKYILDTTRKYALPLLDYMDKIGVTRRVGNTRYKGKQG